MEPNALREIRERYPTLSAAEKKIADYILLHPHQVIHMATALLSEAAGVSEGSIINFANALGFKGFTKLKLDIAQHVGELFPPEEDEITGQDSPKSALRKLSERAREDFQSTLSAVSDQTLRAAADALMRARRIEVYGVGSSSMVAEDIAYRMLRIGLPARSVVDPLVSCVCASFLDAESLAVGVSHTGRTVETLRAMEIARSKGAATLALTSHAQSPLGQLCDLALVSVSREAALCQEAVVSRLSQLLIFDSLCAYISFQRGQDRMELLENYIDLMGQHFQSGEKEGDPL